VSSGWLIVFAKAPRPGLVKTRLSPPLDLEQCAELYDAMLGDVMEASLRFARRLDLLPVLAFHPPDAFAELLGRAPAGYRLQAQRGADLGQRMANAFAEASAAGVERILLRGSDSPALDHSLFEDVLGRLDSGDDLVLTPDQSGGYAMVGMRTARSAIFEALRRFLRKRSWTFARVQSDRFRLCPFPLCYRSHPARRVEPHPPKRILKRIERLECDRPPVGAFGNVSLELDIPFDATRSNRVAIAPRHSARHAAPRSAPQPSGPQRAQVGEIPHACSLRVQRLDSRRALRIASIRNSPRIVPESSLTRRADRHTDCSFRSASSRPAHSSSPHRVKTRGGSPCPVPSNATEVPDRRDSGCVRVESSTT
jgi:glycosyltransferase A (GT-A) superfamily protein (DUF2064 family)